MSAKYRVVVTDPADADILEIAAYIATDNEDTALPWLADMQVKVDSLAKFPTRAPTIPEAPDLGTDLRHLLHGNYRAIFRIDGDQVIILRVVHASRLLDATLLSEG